MSLNTLLDELGTLEEGDLDQCCCHLVAPCANCCLHGAYTAQLYLIYNQCLKEPRLECITDQFSYDDEGFVDAIYDLLDEGANNDLFV